MIQLRLCNVLPQFVVSSESVEGPLRGYLKEVVLSFRFLAVRFSLEYLADVSRKKLYKDLIDILLPVPLYRQLYHTGPGQDVLKRVKRMHVAPGVKTFFFKLHTGTLPVKTWLEDRGLFVPWGTQCLLCAKAETIEHVFIDCWSGIFFWDILQRTLKKDLPLDPHGIRYLPVHNDDGLPYDLVMLLGLHSIWQTRTAAHNADVVIKPVRDYFCESVSRFLEVQKEEKDVPEWVSRMEPLLHMPKF